MRKAVATFCSKRHHDHATAETRALRGLGRTRPESAALRPRSHGQRAHHVSRCLSGFPHGAVENQARQCDAENDRGFGRFRQPFRPFYAINHEAEDGSIERRNGTQPQAADLDEADDRRVRPRDQPAVMPLDADAVVSDELSVKPFALGTIEEAQREGRLAGTGRSANQNAALADDHAGRVNGRRIRPLGGVGPTQAAAACRGAKGRRTINRAPRTVGCPSSSAGPGLFSARIVPRCACTI